MERIEKLGAINYQTVWVLPYSKEIIEKVQNLEKTIENYGGQVLLAEGKVLNKEDEEKFSMPLLKQEIKSIRK